MKHGEWIFSKENPRASRALKCMGPGPRPLICWQNYPQKCAPPLHRNPGSDTVADITERRSDTKIFGLQTGHVILLFIYMTVLRLSEDWYCPSILTYRPVLGQPCTSILTFSLLNFAYKPHWNCIKIKEIIWKMTLVSMFISICLILQYLVKTQIRVWIFEEIP